MSGNWKEKEDDERNLKSKNLFIITKGESPEPCRDTEQSIKDGEAGERERECIPRGERREWRRGTAGQSGRGESSGSINFSVNIFIILMTKLTSTS
jgi:hypothetical protein